MQVLKSADRWYGVTYKEDKQMVMDAICDMKKRGTVPGCILRKNREER